MFEIEGLRQDVDRAPVSSSNVRSIGYDSTMSVLEVEFHGGRIYRYRGVPERHYVALTSGRGSVGSYVNTHIKGRYPFIRVR
jgi:hypothetical protein